MAPTPHKVPDNGSPVLSLAPLSETDRSLVQLSVLPMAAGSQKDSQFGLPLAEPAAVKRSVSVLPMAMVSEATKPLAQKESRPGLSQAEPAAVILSVPDLVPVLVLPLSFHYSDFRYQLSPLFLR